jgi:four helix bundle protein
LPVTVPANTERKDDLRQRTKAFAGLVVRFYINLDKRREELRVLGKQLLRSGTSVAANFRESSRSRSAEEFVAKAELCAQEADDGAGWRRWRHALHAGLKG